MSPAKQPREEVHVDVEGRTLRLSNLDKVLYPRTGTTKGEVLHYYAQVAPTLLPHLADRAVTRIRWPHGVAEGSFFEKNVPQGTPSWVRTVSVPTTGSRGESRHGDRLVFPVVDDLATLTWLVNLAALELHVHQWRVGRNGRPRNADRIVIDLDPGEPATLHECCQVALMVREKLAERDLDARPVTSGSKGLHLYADLPRRLPGEESTALAREVAEDDQGASQRQGVPGLVAERLVEDDHHALLPAGTRQALRGDPRLVGRGRGRCRGPGRARAGADGGGPRPRRGPGRPLLLTFSWPSLEVCGPLLPNRGTRVHAARTHRADALVAWVT